MKKQKATRWKPGNIAYWYCPVCGKYFSDEALTKEITQADTVISPTGNKNMIEIESNASTAVVETGSEAAVNPQTGASGNFMLWVVLLMVSCGGMVGVLAYDRKRKCRH